MVHVTRVDLTNRGIELPSDRVGMVIAQPHVCLTQTEPFTCLPNKKNQKLADVRKTLEISMANPHGAPKTHFTILPEYSIPGLDGFAQIDESISAAQWQPGTIVIGGIDALSKTQFEELANRPLTYLDTEHNALTRIGENEWVNCSVTWVKAADGTVERWLQPKLVPAWEELNIHYQEMFRGNSIFAFKGRLSNGAKYRFSSLLCFDWIGNVGGKIPWRWALDDLEAEAAQGDGELSLSWFFVIQHNSQPSHPTFLTQIPNFFSTAILPRVRRERTCLVFANSAGKAVPGRSDTYGGTSLVFTRSTLFKEETSCPTVSKGGQRFRSSGILGNHRDTYFREKGACIHSFTQINPDQAGGADARTFAVERPYVFPIDSTIDPRTPSDIVPACVKWVNDELDGVEGLGTIYAGCALAPQAITAHQSAVSGFRQLDAKATCKIVTLSTSKAPHTEHTESGKPNDADLWGQDQVEALNHVIHTVTLMRVAASATIASADRGHATFTVEGQTVDLVAVRGNSHQECSEHIKYFDGGQRRKVLFVSRDRDNTPLETRSGSFLQTQKVGIIEDQNITDPQSGKIHLAYHTLLQMFRDSSTQAALLGGINAQLGA